MNPNSLQENLSSIHLLRTNVSRKMIIVKRHYIYTYLERPCERDRSSFGRETFEYARHEEQYLDKQTLKYNNNNNKYAKG